MHIIYRLFRWLVVKFENENESEHDMLKLLGNPSDVEQMKNQM